MTMYNVIDPTGYSISVARTSAENVDAIRKEAAQNLLRQTYRRVVKRINDRIGGHVFANTDAEFAAMIDGQLDRTMTRWGGNPEGTWKGQALAAYTDGGLPAVLSFITFLAKEATA